MTVSRARPASPGFERRALDLSQREIDVPRDADSVVGSPERRHRTRPVPRPDGRHGSPACSIRRVKMWTGTVKRLLLAACLLNLVANALAETSPEPIVRNGVAYVTGGIGQDEVAAFRDVAPRYNLRITFAEAGPLSFRCRRHAVVRQVDDARRAYERAVPVRPRAAGAIYGVRARPGRSGGAARRRTGARRRRRALLLARPRTARGDASV